MTAVAAVVVLIVALVAMNANNARTIRQLRARQAAAQIAARSEDDDVVAVLEASAATSPLARRLLAVRGEDAGVTAAWQHDSNTPTPPEDKWRLLWSDYQSEKDDAARVVAVARYLDAGTRFTEHEVVQFVESVADEGCRDEMRRLLRPRSAQATRSGMFRWSNQASIAICTLTCHCGKPAVSKHFKVVDADRLVVKCASCEKHGTTRWTVDADTVYVDGTTGVGWRCVDGKWVKAAID